MAAHVVLLLREKKDTEDNYQRVLETCGHQTKFVPVLDFNFINLESLANLLVKINSYSGLVFTSQVAVQAVYDSITSSSQKVDQSLLLQWSSLPVFVVGTATKDLVQKLLSLDAIGEGCGNAESLSQFIIEYFKSHPSVHPLLFPCGTLHKDTLSVVLAKANIDITPQICYETVPHPLIEQRLNEMVVPPSVIVFFSPSGVQFGFSFIKNLLLVKLPTIKMCAIGPTTGEVLKRECDKLSMDVFIAQKPTPDNLLTIINQF